MLTQLKMDKLLDEIIVGDDDGRVANNSALCADYADTNTDAYYTGIVYT
jgi:hypothetical protein